MKTVCASAELARYVVDKCTREKCPVSNLQLQKIMYFLQAVFCNANKTLLFREEFEAWPYGPVLREVYRTYSCYGGRPIDEEYEDLDSNLLGEYKSFIDQGIEVLREKYPWDLVRISHADSGPWKKVWRNGAGNGDKISNMLICGNLVNSR